MIQGELFASDTENNIEISDIASILSVSEASVRNWVRTGYLDTAGRRLVSRSSFDNFVRTIAGKEKLTRRANKSWLDGHNHGALCDEVTAMLGQTSVDLSVLAEQYESGLSNSYRNAEGIYYTPIEICRELVKAVPANLSGMTFCDPCCGSGNFLIAALEAGVRSEDLHGYDTDPIAIEIAKKRILEVTGYDSDKILCADYLDIAELSTPRRRMFDVIITNPPWGKKFPQKKRQAYGELFKSRRSIDTSALFFFAAMASLKRGGYLGLLLPDAFFNISSFHGARDALLENRLIALYDYEKPFKRLLTKTKAFLIKADMADENIGVRCVAGSKNHIRKQKSFAANPSSIINFSCSPQEEDVISRFFLKPHITLQANARWGLGIVTGNNKRFCKPQPADGYMPVYKGSEIFPEALADPSNYIPQDTTLYQQVAPIVLYEAPEKLIYRFISSKLVFFYDTEQRYILNSANMIVMDAAFPISTRKVADLFNTRIYNWVYKNLFGTHKVLKSNIEKLPIFLEFLNQTDTVNESALLDYLYIEEKKDGTYQTKG